MDHPDFPMGMRLPKKKKAKSSDKADSKSKGKSTSSTNVSQQSWPANLKQASDQRSHPPREDSFGFMKSRSSQESNGPGRKLSLLSSKKSKAPPPQPLEALPQRRPDDQQLSHRFLAAKHPDVNVTPHLGLKEPILGPLPSPGHDFTGSQGSSQPPTPGWLPPGTLSNNEQARFSAISTQGLLPGQPLPPNMRPLPNYPPGQFPGEHYDPDMALFAAATSGLTPEQAQWAQMQRQHPLPPMPPGAQGKYPPPPSAIRHHSASSSSANSIALQGEPMRLPPGQSEESLRAYRTLTGLPKSAPDLTNNRVSQPYPFPPGHPLARWATQSSISSQGSGSSTRGSMYEQIPLPPQSHPQAAAPTTTIAAAAATAQNAQTSQGGEQRPSRSLDKPRSPVSPLSPPPNREQRTSQQSVAPPENLPQAPPIRPLEMPIQIPSRDVSPEPSWLNRRVSALTIDTGATPQGADRPNARNSIVSAMSTHDDVSPIDAGDLSPLEPEEDLPDYATSQVEMQRFRQQENERRAQELQRRWMASTGGR